MFSLPKPFVYTLIPTAELYSHYFLLSYLFWAEKGRQESKTASPKPRGVAVPRHILFETGDLLPSPRSGEKQRGPQHDLALPRHRPPWEVPTSFHRCADSQKWVRSLTEGPCSVLEPGVTEELQQDRTLPGVAFKMPQCLAGLLILLSVTIKLEASIKILRSQCQGFVIQRFSFISQKI